MADRQGNTRSMLAASPDRAPSAEGGGPVA